MPGPRSKLFGRVEPNGDPTKYVCIKCGYSTFSLRYLASAVSAMSQVDTDLLVPVARSSSHMYLHYASGECPEGATQRGHETAATHHHHYQAVHNNVPLWSWHDVMFLINDCILVAGLPLETFENPWFQAMMAGIQIFSAQHPEISLDLALLAARGELVLDPAEFAE
ncbi:hypothetical protein AMAG_01496 [Allomyces macrogynus ATCC 38327]|uniref:Uncharacterized protein n=1 Tax=Allomyces macrogynus (strain ATCC 38327) TaxID=578462 RepID=A0A0L0RYX8_ALLM3|nr:hypothetical protein AMAG_01496 [Allomyces macrogynus ATCC 38327]|eukprot:KNE55607.1 hypothetical protein AMAG_01496 [Allomyces macrogynus ATCC 38327]